MEKNEQKKITFKDLSGWLKLSVIFSFIVGAIYVLFFVLGFMSGAAA